MNPLVLTRRPLTVRILDASLTALGWLAFSYLATAGILAVASGVDHSLEFTAWGGVVPTSTALLLYITISALNAMLLMLWGTYRRRLTRIAPLGAANADEAMLAEHFALSAPQLHDIRLSRLLVIHHADDGVISHWESADNAAIRLSA